MSEQRSGTIKIHDTSINVWEEHVDEPGMRRVLDVVLRHFGARGFTMQMDPEVVQRWPCLADTHWIGKLGDLHVEAETSGRHLKVEFWQELNVDNRYGGRHDFGKFERMPRPLRWRCVVEMANVIGALADLGYQSAGHGNPKLARRWMLQEVLHIADGRPLHGGDPLWCFNGTDVQVTAMSVRSRVRRAGPDVEPGCDRR